MALRWGVTSVLIYISFILCRTLLPIKEDENVARHWLTSLYKKTIICSSSIETLLQRATLRAIKSSAPLLIENIECQFSGFLQHFLNLKYDSQGRRCICFDEKLEVIPLHWSLFFCSTLRYPTFPPAVLRSFNIVNFSVGSEESVGFFMSVFSTIWDEKDVVRYIQASLEDIKYCQETINYQEKLLLQLANEDSSVIDSNGLIWSLLQEIQSRHEFETKRVKHPMNMTAKPYLECLMPTVCCIFESYVCMGMVNHNYIFAFEQFMKPMHKIVQCMKNHWQVDILRLDQESTVLTHHSHKGNASNINRETSSSCHHLNRQGSLTLKTGGSAELKELISEAYHAMSQVVRSSDQLLWRFIFAMSTIKHLMKWKEECSLTTSLLHDISCIWNGQNYYFPITGVDQLRRPSWIDKNVWANLCVITKHRGFEYLYEYAVAHEMNIKIWMMMSEIEFEDEPAVFNHLSVGARLFHKFIMYVNTFDYCFDSKLSVGE